MATALKHVVAGQPGEAALPGVGSDRPEWVDGDVADYVTLRCCERGRYVLGLHVGVVVVLALPGLDGHEGARCGCGLVQLELGATTVVLGGRGQPGERLADDLLRPRLGSELGDHAYSGIGTPSSRDPVFPHASDDAHERLGNGAMSVAGVVGLSRPSTRRRVIPPPDGRQ